MDSPFQSPRLVRFHDLAVGGQGVGRDESGKTIFAPFSAPGDVSQVIIEEEKTSFARGVVLRRETDGMGRTTPPCPYFRPETPHQSCGGCAWQHLTIETQREAKRQLVQSVLERIGGQQVEVEGCFGAEAFGYRNKADFVVEAPGNGTSGNGTSENGIGFYAAHSHDLIDIDSCLIQHPVNEAVLRIARELLARSPQRNFMHRLLARVSTRGEGLLVVSAETASFDETKTFAAEMCERLPHLVGALTRDGRGALRLVHGRDHLIEDVNGLSFRVTGAGFWQVNAQVSSQLAQTALDWLAPRRGERVLDLFCGAGLFALHLARQGAEVTGVELSKSAIMDARFNAEANGLKAQFAVADGARWLQARKKGDFDAVLLDPPRSGAKEAMRHLIRIAPSRIVYVSCDPATLARDGRELKNGGYQLQNVRCYDLFPQTAHVETVACFERQ